MNTRPDHPVLAVSVCLTDASRVLLVERKNAPLAGKLSLPGGKVRLDESLDAAARRELCEETGLVADDLAFVAVHEAIEAEIHAVIHVFKGVLHGEPVAGDDAASVRMMPLAEVASAERRGETTQGLAAIVERAASGEPIA